MNLNKLVLVLTLTACGGNDRAQFVNGLDGTNGVDGSSNDARVAELERRADLNDTLDQLQSSLIEANTASITALQLRATAQESSQVAGDALLQAQIDSILASISSITTDLNSVQDQADSNTGDINTINNNITNLYADMDDLNHLLDDSVEDLQEQIDDLNDLIDGLPTSSTSIDHSTSTCTALGGNYYMKDTTLYLENDSNHCDHNNDKVSLSNADSAWVSATKLVVKVSGSLLVFNF